MKEETKKLVDFVPYIVHESEVARLERIIKRLWILCIIIFITLVISNLAWLYYESQWEDVVTTQTITQDLNTDGGGDAIINDGVHINGESEADN